MVSSDGDETFSNEKSEQEDQEANGDAAGGGDRSLGVCGQRDYCSHHSYKQSPRVLAHPSSSSSSSFLLSTAMEEGQEADRERGLSVEVCEEAFYCSSIRLDKPVRESTLCEERA